MNPSATAKPLSREALATQRTALQGQIERLAQGLTDAEAASNRAVAAAAVNGSKEATARRTEALGKVARAQAELSAARAALVQIEADLEALDERRRVQVDHAKTRAAAAAIGRAIELARKVDASAMAFADDYRALQDEVGKLYSVVPDRLKEPVFGGGSNLGAKALHSTATYLLSHSSIVPRPLYLPTEHRQKLATLVEMFGKPVLDAVAALPTSDAEPEWV